MKVTTVVYVVSLFRFHLTRAKKMLLCLLDRSWVWFHSFLNYLCSSLLRLLRLLNLRIHTLADCWITIRIRLTISVIINYVRWEVRIILNSRYRSCIVRSNFQFLSFFITKFILFAFFVFQGILLLVIIFFIIITF